MAYEQNREDRPVLRGGDRGFQHPVLTGHLRIGRPPCGYGHGVPRRRDVEKEKRTLRAGKNRFGKDRFRPSGSFDDQSRLFALFPDDRSEAVFGIAVFRKRQICFCGEQRASGFVVAAPCAEKQCPGQQGQKSV